MSKRRDIRFEADIRRILDTFYQDIRKDNVLGDCYCGLSLHKHLPGIYSFWSSVILDEAECDEHVFERHLTLPLSRHEHLERWTTLFKSAVDRYFAGRPAERMKGCAAHLAMVFQRKMDLDQSKMISHV